MTLTDDDGAFIASIAITYTDNSFFGVIPLEFLGNDDGLLDFTSIIGTVPQPTDATDSIGTSVFAIPEPTFAVILFSGLAGMVTTRRKRG